jgi:hypothetical protein
MHIIKAKVHTKVDKPLGHLRVDARLLARRLENKAGLNPGCKGRGY